VAQWIACGWAHNPEGGVGGRKYKTLKVKILRRTWIVDVGGDYHACRICKPNPAAGKYLLRPYRIRGKRVESVNDNVILRKVRTQHSHSQTAQGRQPVSRWLQIIRESRAR